MAKTVTERDHHWRIGSGGFIGNVTLQPVEWPNVLAKVQRRRPLMFLTYLFVHPLRRGLGWADELMRAATTFADRKGIDLWLYARPYGLRRTKDGRRVSYATEEALVAFYRKHGFRPIDGAGHRNEMVRRCRAQKS